MQGDSGQPLAKDKLWMARARLNWKAARDSPLTCCQQGPRGGPSRGSELCLHRRGCPGHLGDAHELGNRQWKPGLSHSYPDWYHTPALPGMPTKVPGLAHRGEDTGATRLPPTSYFGNRQTAVSTSTPSASMYRSWKTCQLKRKRHPIPAQGPR